MEPTASGDTGAVVALHYHENGWPPLPLPARMKEHPPKGLTGYDGRDLTAAEVLAHDWSGNIAVRMPDDVIGIDVDAYKGGAITLADLTARLGELPPTVMTHSNRNDGSGIRFFRVQAGHAWTTGLPGIEIVQRTHRYALVPPSMHPEGRRYAIADEQDLFFDSVIPVLPPVDELPLLPQAWHDELSVHADSRTHARAADVHERDTFLGSYTGTDAPRCLDSVVAHYRERTGAGNARHDTMQHCLSWAMEEARAGLFSAVEARDALRQVWEVSLGTDVRRAGSWEYDAMLRHAVGKANARTQDWINAKHDEHAGIPMVLSQSMEGGTQVSPERDIEADALVPGMFLDWDAFARRATAPRDWLVEGLWPSGRALALWASAKEGKSELALWCACKMALGLHAWTDAPCEPVDVAYFDYEMTEDDLDERLNDFGFDPTRLTRLHYALLPALFPLDMKEGGEQLIAHVRDVGAQAVVIDTLMRSVKGEENKSDTLQDFYRHTGIRLKQLGIGYLRTDHAGKDGARGMRGSSGKRDDVDVAWRLTRTKNGDGVVLDSHGLSRLSWVGPKLELDRIIDPNTDLIRYALPVQLAPTWGHAVFVKANELDAASVPLDATVTAARAALKAAGVTPGRQATLTDALKFRRSQAGNASGNAGNPLPGNAGP